jgi:pantothenate synthetase
MLANQHDKSVSPRFTDFVHAKWVYKALEWNELAAMFIPASRQFGPSEELRKYPSNLRGLCSFMKNAHRDGMITRPSWQALFPGEDPNAFGEPRRNSGFRIQEEKSMPGLTG